MQSANAKYTLYFTHHKYQMHSICISVQITVQMLCNEHRNTDCISKIDVYIQTVVRHKYSSKPHCQDCTDIYKDCQEGADIYRKSAFFNHHHDQNQ